MLTIVFGLILILIEQVFVFGLDNGVGRTPPMGWLSWGYFRGEIDCVKKPNGCINADLYMKMADKLVDDGWSTLGYKYVLLLF